MLVRTTKRIAGFPPPGKVGQVDDEVARAAIERGDAEDMSSLSTRLRRRAPEQTVTGGGELPPSPGPREPAPSQSAPSGDADLGEHIEQDLAANPVSWSQPHADHPNDDA